MTEVGSAERAASLGLILPPTTQGELVDASGATYGSTGSASELSELCRQAEATGADSLWAVDHLFWPHPMGESLTTLAVAASVTTRPRLGTCILQLPLRHPAAVAKQALALQLLSEGRFVLGLGVGIHEGEYVRAGVDYHRRGRLMDEGIAAMRAAWDDDAASDYRMLPTADPVPLWIGGSSPAARRRAASVGDGWIPLFLTPEEYAPALAELRRETAEAGRDPESVAAGVVMFAYVDDDPAGPERGAEWLSRLYRLPPKAFRRHLVAGSPQTCAGALERYAEAGARHILIMVAGSPAVRHFALLHAEYTGRPERVLVEAPA